MKRAAGWTILTTTGALVLLATLIGPLGCEQKAPSAAGPAPGPTKELTILTPQSDAICDAFAEGFWNWHLAKRGAPVRVKWVHRGTPQCVDYVRAGVDIAAAGGRYVAPDIVFGGGITEHGKLMAEGFCCAVDLGDALTGIPADVQGQATRDPQGRWFATGLSSFGIVYNERACTERGIAPPTTWTDLADPRFYGWVAVADPLASSSHRECLTLILQQQGWPEGWRTIVRILGNARALNARSADAIRQVESGVSLVAFAVNFDGMAAAADSAGALKYIDPPGASAVSLDIISVLANAPNPELAKDFVRFVLSEEGQALWAVRRDVPGPSGAALYHYAIRPSVYEKFASTLAVRSDPLKTEFGLRLNSEQNLRQGQLVKSLVRAACRESNHVRLQQAWRKLIDRSLPSEGVAELTAPLFDEQAMAAAAAQLEKATPADTEKLEADWAAKLAEKYGHVQEVAGR